MHSLTQIGLIALRRKVSLILKRHDSGALWSSDLFSDMPMSEMAKDPDFPKKWMFGMAMMLKKGLHLHQIHNLDRSFDEMMLGLESWIPMYMTGQISPYYLKGVQNSVFLHFLKVSGPAALTGEASAVFTVAEVLPGKIKRGGRLLPETGRSTLKNAIPLMDIFHADNAGALQAFLVADSHQNGNRRNILSALPLYTMDAAFLETFLSARGISSSAGAPFYLYRRPAPDTGGNFKNQSG